MPVNTAERVAVCFAMLLGATVFGYIVANVGNLMSGLNRTQGIIQEKISDVTEYLSEKQVPRNLSSSIIRYYKQMMKHTSAYGIVLYFDVL